MCDNVCQERVVVGNIDVHCDQLSFITTLEGRFEIATLPNRMGAEVIQELYKDSYMMYTRYGTRETYSMP